MKNSNFLTFNSISELMTELDNAPVIPGRDDSSEDRDRGSSWCDTSSWEEAHDNMIYGKIYDNISADLKKYKTNGCKDKPTIKKDVVGHSVNVPLYLSGAPRCMYKRMNTINNKIINIIYNCSVPCMVDQDDIVKTTTELMKNIIKLEQDGYRVNLYIMEYNDNDDGYGFLLKLKTDRETLNIKKLCFPLVSSSFLRRIDFRIKERLYKDWIGGGYGSARFNRDKIEQFVFQTLKIKHYEMWNYEGLKFKL